VAKRIKTKIKKNMSETKKRVGIRIYYESKGVVEGGRKWEDHLRRIRITGKVKRVIDIKKGTFTNRNGRKVYGLRIVYETRDGVIHTKTIELPKNAVNIVVRVSHAGTYKL